MYRTAHLCSFGKNLLNLLRNKKIPQSKLAEFLGTTQQTISRWINGVNEPDFETLFRICGYLDTDPNEILGFTENMPDILYAIKEEEEEPNSMVYEELQTKEDLEALNNLADEDINALQSLKEKDIKTFNILEKENKKVT